MKQNFSEGHIKVLNELYTIKVTESKRKLIYENNKLVGSTPYIINDDKEILKK